MALQDAEKIINNAVDKFKGELPAVQAALLSTLTRYLDLLDLRVNGTIKPTAANLKTALKIQNILDNSLYGNNFLKSIDTLTGIIPEITSTINDFYKTVFNINKPTPIAKAVRDAARNNVIDSLTRDLSGGLTDGVRTQLNNAIISGMEYVDLAETLKTLLDDSVQRYATQLAIDALNGYARQYNVAMSAGLNFQWFQYSGTNIATTRAFCIAAKRKKYIHVSEFPKVVLGDFPEFKEAGGKIYERYGLPEGMRIGTNAQNFRVNCGGYNCGHQLRPLYERLVPKSVQDRVYSTPDYMNWKASNPGKFL